MAGTPYSSTNWFTQLYPSVSSLPLAKICFPGSHDSGMSELNSSSALGGLLKSSTGPFTQTQNLDIHDQIVKAGMRYIDLRPAWVVDTTSKNPINAIQGYYAAHWSQLTGPFFIGLPGQSLDDVCRNFADAFSEIGQNEIVFIEVSHGAQLSFGRCTYSDLSEDQQSEIMQKIVQALKPYLFTASDAVNILTLTPSDIFNGREAGPKAILWHSGDTFSNCGLSGANGVFGENNVPYYNAWDDISSNDPSVLIAGLADSLGKYAHKPPPKSPYFMSWHCQFMQNDGLDAISAEKQLSSLADQLNPQFSAVLSSWQSSGTIDYENAFPTFIAWDFVTQWDANDQNMVASCISLTLNETNQQVASDFYSPTGIGGYDLSSNADLAFAFDYDSSGKKDHIAVYRPGTSIFYVLQNDSGSFSPAYATHAGIGGYDLASPADLSFAFDYDSSGKDDHIALYRPGAGIFYILKRYDSEFSTIYSTHNGIGGYDLASPVDLAFAFDYDSSGKNDHIALLRPGAGIFYVLGRNGNNFSTVYQTHSGIGGYDLSSGNDLAFAFDYDGSGKNDHIVLYRPGKGICWILKRDGNDFSPVFPTIPNTVGIDGYDLSSPYDRLLAIDWYGDGTSNQIVAYRPGKGIIFVIEKEASGFQPIVQYGSGIAGFGLGNVNDKAFPFDFDSSGVMGQLCLYRPGAGGTVTIASRVASAEMRKVLNAMETGGLPRIGGVVDPLRRLRLPL